MKKESKEPKKDAKTKKIEKLKGELEAIAKQRKALAPKITREDRARDEKLDAINEQIRKLERAHEKISRNLGPMNALDDKLYAKTCKIRDRIEALVYSTVPA